MLAPRFASWFALFLGGVALCCSSCSSGHQTVYTARGKVLFEGKPAKGAVVVLHPTNDPSPDGPRPHGTVDSEGSFQLTTYKRNDGAPPGEFDVTVTWTKPLRPGEKEEMSLLPVRYLRPQTSGLHVQIKPEANNELPSFELKK